MKELTVSQTIVKLNSIVSIFHGRKIGEISRDLHEPLQKAIEEFMESISTTSRTWDILHPKYKEMFNHPEYDAVLKYSIDIEQDKRTTWTRGRIKRIYFRVPQKIAENFDDVGSLPWSCFIRRVLWIDRMERKSAMEFSISNQRKQLSESINYINALYLEIEQIENDIFKEDLKNIIE